MLHILFKKMEFHITVNKFVLIIVITASTYYLYCHLLQCTAISLLFINWKQLNLQFLLSICNRTFRHCKCSIETARMEFVQVCC